MKKNYFIFLIFSLLISIGCTDSISNSEGSSGDLQLPPSATDKGYLYGDFSLTVNGDQVKSSPAAKYYSYYVLGGSFTLPAAVDRYYKYIDLYEANINHSGSSYLQSADYYQACADYVMTVLYKDFYPYSSNTILTYASESGVNTLKVESAGIFDNSVIDKIELVVNNLQVTDFNTELTFNSSTPDRVLTFSYKNGTKFSSLMPGSSVKVVIGNLGLIDDITTITINNSTLFISTGSLESISMQGTINAYRL